MIGSVRFSATSIVILAGAVARASVRIDSIESKPLRQESAPQNIQPREQRELHPLERSIQRNKDARDLEKSMNEGTEQRERDRLIQDSIDRHERNKSIEKVNDDHARNRALQELTSSANRIEIREAEALPIPSKAEPYPGAEMRDNILSLLRFVLPQLERGSGEIPLGAVVAAFRPQDFGISAESIAEIESRGSIKFAGGKGKNEGIPVKASVPHAFLRITFNLDGDVSGDVSQNSYGGFTISRIKGIRLAISRARVPLHVRQIIMTPEFVLVKTELPLGIRGPDQPIDLRRAN